MNKGFTLVELLVIISMITILSTFVFFDYGASSKVFELERTAQKIAQDMRLMQQQALSGIEGGASTNGYGLYFSVSNNNYSIYQNNNVNPYYDGEDLILQTIAISSDVKIESLKRGNTSLSNLSISFFPPGPMTYIEGYSNDTEGSITLYLVSNESEKRMIKINNSGRIEITRL
jgi:type II secretory pathway pseudopilin PulG